MERDDRKQDRTEEIREDQREAAAAEREQRGRSARETREAGRRARGGARGEDIEATDTDGKGTGGMGADAGGYGPVPGSDATG